MHNLVYEQIFTDEGAPKDVLGLLIQRVAIEFKQSILETAMRMKSIKPKASVSSLSDSPSVTSSLNQST